MSESQSEFPSQEEFMQTGLEDSTVASNSELDDFQCPICCEGPNESEEIVNVRKCGHHFHRVCILQWFSSADQSRATCPQCRRELFIPDQLTEEQVSHEPDLDYPTLPFRFPTHPDPEIDATIPTPGPTDLDFVSFAEASYIISRKPPLLPQAQYFSGFDRATAEIYDIYRGHVLQTLRDIRELNPRIADHIEPLTVAAHSLIHAVIMKMGVENFQPFGWVTPIHGPQSTPLIRSLIRVNVVHSFLRFTDTLGPQMGTREFLHAQEVLEPLEELCATWEAEIKAQGPVRDLPMYLRALLQNLKTAKFRVTHHRREAHGLCDNE